MLQNTKVVEKIFGLVYEKISRKNEIGIPQTRPPRRKPRTNIGNKVV